MKVSKQQKILGAILVLGLGVVGADQFMRSKGGEESGVNATSEYAVVKTTAKPQAAMTAANSSAKLSIAQRLRNANQPLAGGQVRDAFALSSSWDPPVMASIEQIDVAAQQFQKEHHLTGVLISAGHGYAMLDGKIIALGQHVDGFKLVSIEHRAATFERGTAKVALSLAERNAMAGAQ